MNVFYSIAGNVQKEQEIHMDLCRKLKPQPVHTIGIDELLYPILPGKIRSGDILVLHLIETMPVQLLLKSYDKLSDYRLIIINDAIEKIDKHRLLKFHPRYICYNSRNLNPVIQVISNILLFDSMSRSTQQERF